MLLSGLAENLLTLASYHDQEAKLVRNAVPPELYGGPYKVIAARVYDFIDRYKKAPKDHIADILSDKLESKDNKREANLYADILDGIRNQAPVINKSYTLSQLQTFIDRQSLRSIAVDLTKALQRDTEESIDEAKDLLGKARTQQLSVFDPGLRLSDTKRALRFLDIQDQSFPTGIPEFDRRGFGPTRKELWMLIASTGHGKTWGLIQLAKMALLQRLRVCHISLEMGEERCSQRYFQALLAISKRKEAFNVTKFERDQLGRVTDYVEHRVTSRLSLDDPNIRSKLTKRAQRMIRLLDNVYIRDFPTGALSMRQLEAYLDNLENTERFTPDLLIVDYPDLMDLGDDELRIALDLQFKGIRGIAGKRNLAAAVVSQSHRSGAKTKTLGLENIAEAWAKNTHVDVAMTYSQTEAERKLSLARLFLAKGRNDSDKFTVVISQNYGLGQFVVDSTLMNSDYWNRIGE